MEGGKEGRKEPWSWSRSRSRSRLGGRAVTVWLSTTGMDLSCQCVTQRDTSLPAFNSVLPVSLAFSASKWIRCRCTPSSPSRDPVGWEQGVRQGSWYRWWSGQEQRVARGRAHCSSLQSKPSGLCFQFGGRLFLSFSFVLLVQCEAT